MENAGLNPPENRPPPPLHLHPHLPHLAQYELHTLMVRPRPPDILHSTNLHPLLHPRPLPPLPPPPSPHLPPNTNHHIAPNLLLRPLPPPPPPPQLPPRRPPQNGSLRRRHSHGLDQPQPLPLPLLLRLLLRRLQRLLGPPQLRLPPRLVLPTCTRRSHVRLRLPRMVVVRTHDYPLRPSPQPQSHHCFHGNPHPNHLPHLRLPLLPQPRRLHPRRQRARRQPPRQGPHFHDGLTRLRPRARPRRHCFHHPHATPMGQIFHRRRRNS